jgi:hypothetical protein
MTNYKLSTLFEPEMEGQQNDPRSKKMPAGTD